MPTLVDGCTYAYKTGGKTIYVKLLRFDPITRRHVVTTDGGKNEWQLRGSSLGARVRCTKPKKMDTSQTYLYMCNVGDNVYKIGATCAPERRRKQIWTYAPKASMKSIVKIPRARGNEWASIEKQVLHRFAAHRIPSGGKEVLRMTAQQATECAGYMRSVCSG